MSDELTPFEKRLAQLEPKSSIDPEQLVYSLGQANVLQPSSTAWHWKAFAICSTVAAVVMFVALMTSIRALEDVRQREVVLLQRLVDSSNATTRPAIEQRENSRQDARQELPLAPRIDLAAAAADLDSQFQRKRQAFDSKVTLPGRVRLAKDDTPLSWGETRRVLAMVGESTVGLRRIDTLQPQ